MVDPDNLQRFLDAQSEAYGEVTRELADGRKQTHWMWFVFPQLKGLGRTATAEHFGIASLDEARAYLAHPVLGPRLSGRALHRTDLFGAVLDRYYGGQSDERTLTMISMD